jgi:hypothetical protein
MAMFHYIAVAVYMKTRMMDNHLIVMITGLL